MSDGSGIPLTDREVIHLMLAVAEKWEFSRCSDDDCDACMKTRDLWWDLWNRLTDDARYELAVAAMLARILYPPTPPFQVVS
jgi:hypothetical protein